MFRDLLVGLIGLVYPAVCCLCQTPLTENRKALRVCLSCEASLRPNHPPFCAKCSLPLADPERPVCPRCERRPLSYDRCWSVLLYNPTMRRMLHLFKYGGKTGLRFFLEDMTARFVRDYRVPVEEYDAVIPIPLSATRRRERGFNQSELIAAGLARRFGVPLCTRTLLRARHTPNQARLSQKERWTNLRGAFKINYSHINTYRNILIVDDLLTTGATLCEAARVLKENGAKRVDGLTAAIAHDHSIKDA